jgi:ABC-type sugar transport system ATPase subunit
MIELRDLSVTSGSFQLTNLALVVPTGGYGVLMGSTGSGKTTILEAICGLRTIASGRVLLGGVDVTSWSVGSRGIGYVPQDAALFPTLSVWEHLALGLKLRRVGRVEIANRVAEVAEALGIAHLLKRTPHHLSGGEARRVAIGRAIAFHPQLLLLDEPLSALDEDHRGRLVELLQSLHRSERFTTLHVTHYRDEAAAVGEHFFQLTHNQIVVCERPQAGHITRHGMANASEGNEGNIEPDTTTAQPCTDREP